MKNEGTTPIAATAEEDGRFRAHFEHLPVGMAQLGLDGRLLQANPCLCGLLGAPRDELLGSRLDDHLHPHDRAAAQEQIARLTQGEQPGCTLRLRLLHRDGAAIPVKLSIGIRPGAAGLTMAADDVSALQLAEQARRQSDERLRMALDAAEMDAFDYDPLTDHVHRHGRLGCALGLSPDSTGEEVTSRVHPEDMLRYRAAVAQLHPGRPGYMLEYRLRAPDGSWRSLVDQAVGRFDAQGRLVKLVGVCTDVTERRRADEALVKERELLRQIIDHIPVMLCLYDPPSRRYRLNRHFETVLGWRTADANSSDFLARAYPDPARRAEMVAFMQSSSAEWREWSAAARDGTPVPCEWTRVRLSNGTLIGIGLDRRQRRANEARLARHAARQALLLEVTGKLLQNGHDEAELVRSVFEQVRGPLEADVCLGHRLNRTDGALVLVNACGIAPELLETAAHLAQGQTGYCSRVAATSRPLVVDAARIAQDRQAAFARALGLRACVCHPLLAADGQVIGTFALASTRRDGFAQEDVDFLQTLCHYIALAWERIRSERELLRREQQYRLALDAGQLGAWRRRLKSDRFELDARARAHFGLDAPELSVATLLARVHPEDRPRLEAEIAAMDLRSPGEEARSLEYRVIHPDGSERWLAVEAKIFCEPGEYGETCLCIGTTTDITERKRIEHALRQTAANLKRAQAVAHVGSWEVDFRRNQARCSDETCRIFGLPPGSPLDHADFLARVHPLDRQEVEACWQAALRGAPYDLEHRIFVGEGGRWVRQRAELEFDAHGRPIAAFGTIQDITERKLADEALREIAAERSEAARRKDAFLATLAHELRNPLNPIRSAAKVLRLGGGDDPQLRWSCEVIERQVGHLTRLIDDLLDVSRITHDKLGLQRRRLALREVVDGAVESILPLVEKQQHVLTLDLPAEELVLEGDPVRLVQVFQNLLDNAAKYTPPGGRITLAARRDGHVAEVGVRDSGIGLRPEALARVFDMFYQAERTSTQAGSGLGIGLTLVERLVRMHGGSVEARSVGEGRGCEFVVRLPLAAPAQAEPAAPQPAADEASREDGTVLPHRILVVDDNVDSAEGTALLLRMDGHEVHLAHDGLQAVREAERLQPTLVLLDIGMPVLNGYEAAQRIRASDWGRDMLLVAQTGWGQQDDIRRAREAGFDAHFTKPVDPEALRRLLARKRPVAG